MGARGGLRRKPRAGPRIIKIAINLSPKQFKSANIVQTVVGAIVAAGIAPSRVELEITETALLEESEQTLETLRQLQNFGVRIALDDFGTGYSSLSYLRSFPFNKLKIDRSFVSALSNDAEHALPIVRAIIQMGRSLGMSIDRGGRRDERAARGHLRGRLHGGAGLPVQRPQTGGRDRETAGVLVTDQRRVDEPGRGRLRQVRSSKVLSGRYPTPGSRRGIDTPVRVN